MADSTEKFLLKKKCDSASGKQVSGRRASCYSPQFKAQVVKFASRSTRDNTKKLFGIPDSTLTSWIAKAKKQRGIINSEGGSSVIKEPSSEPRGMVESLSPSSMVASYPDSFKETVVRFGELQGWKAAANKFGVKAATICAWARRLGKSIHKRLDAGSVEEVVKYEEESKAVPCFEMDTAIGEEGVKNGRDQTWERAGKICVAQSRKVHKLDRREQLGDDGSNSLVLTEEEHGLKAAGGEFAIGKYEIMNNRKEISISPVVAQPLPPVESFSSTEDVAREKCKACGAALAADETLLEHVVSRHLTMEGLCDICGENQPDFVAHFKVHLNQASLPMVIVKTEILDELDKYNNNTDPSDYTTINNEANDVITQPISQSLAQVTGVPLIPAPPTADIVTLDRALPDAVGAVPHVPSLPGAAIV